MPLVALVRQASGQINAMRGYFVWRRGELSITLQ